MWVEQGVFEVDAPSIDEYPLGSISADELREKYVICSVSLVVPEHEPRAAWLCGLGGSRVLLAGTHRILNMRRGLLITGGLGSPSSSAPLPTVRSRI
jgi:hypothetical protein